MCNRGRARMPRATCRDLELVSATLEIAMGLVWQLGTAPDQTLCDGNRSHHSSPKTGIGFSLL